MLKINLAPILFINIVSVCHHLCLVERINIYEPVASVSYSYKLACAYSEDSNQSGHTCSLNSLSFSPEETLVPWLPIERQSKTRIRLRGCTCQLKLVPFAGHSLIFMHLSLSIIKI